LIEGEMNGRAKNPPKKAGREKGLGEEKIRYLEHHDNNPVFGEKKKRGGPNGAGAGKSEESRTGERWIG